MRHAIYTIGYEGSTIEDFVETLKENDISLLVDIRDFPGSRKKGFSKSTLSAILHSFDIGYIHLRGLGDPKEGRDAARAGKRKDFLRIFHTHLKTTDAQIDLSRAAGLVAAEPACLLCYERDHTQCHRDIVASLLAERESLSVRNLQVRHGAADMDSYTEIPHLTYA